MRTLAQIIGENIKTRRVKMGLTQQKLHELAFGDAANVSICRWERGDFCPGAFALKGLSEAFGCTIDELFLEDENAEL